jgi:glycosyltransferase involved in cell wall biosynthesis
MKVSVVVPAYNEEKMLGPCLRSLRSQTVPCEIVVCDNNSTDGTYGIAKRYAHKVVSEKRQGAAFALNTGLMAASGDFIAITGADCSVPPDWIENFLRHFNDGETIACYGPIDPLEDRHRIYFSAMNYAEKLCIRLGLWFVIQGANFIIRKDAMERAGYFNPEVELFEENGFFRKIRKMGRVRFVSGNPIRASTRRVDKCGKPFLIVLGARQMLKLTLLKRTDTSQFAPVRK